MFKDILGFGKASEKLLDLIGKACGTVYRPIAIRREAAAKAEEIRLLGAAAAEVEAEKIRIVGLADAEQKLLAADTDIEILQRAKARLVAREVQRQSNIESIAQIALQELPKEVSEEPVEDNWRVRFFNIAEDVTDSDMQALWGKVLAGEVASPGRYSLRTLEVLRNLSRYEAEIFQRACGLTFDGGFIAKLEDTEPRERLRIPDPPSSHFIDFGVTYNDILTLIAAGLVSSGDDIVWTFQAAGLRTSETQRVLVMNNGVPVVLEGSSKENLYLSVIVLTPAGRELRSLVPSSPNLPYLRRVAEGLRVRGVEMYRAKTIDGVIHSDQREEL